jgi:hypothetical protein
MGRISIILSDDLDKELRNFIKNSYFKPHGKITEVIDMALKLFLKKEKELIEQEKADLTREGY